VSIPEKYQKLINRVEKSCRSGGEGGVVKLAVSFIAAYVLH
jgi:hypothetical protein